MKNVGFVDETQNEYGEPFRGYNSKLEAASQGLMSQPATTFDDTLRWRVDSYIREACAFRG